MEKRIRNAVTDLQDYCRQIGVDWQTLTVIAATKTQSVETINLLPSCGIHVAAENRVQEFLEKYDKTSGVEWQFIGRLQTNKVKYLIDKVTLIQSVDRAELAQEIQKQAKKHGKIMPILLEVNVGREAEKGGVLPENLEMLYKEVYTMDCVRVVGLMSVLPKNAPEQLYEQMHSLFQAYRQKDEAFRYLSMGMSGDYRTALKHGANMIRLGTALFGERKGAKKENAEK